MMGTQSSSVQPGYTVDSYTTTSSFLMVLPTVWLAPMSGCRPGRRWRSIGVGTVTMEKLQSSKAAISVVMVRRVAAFSSCGSTSSELSRPALSSAMRALLMSKPTTGNCLPNSTASGSPTKPRPITPILVMPISNIPNSLCKRTLLTPADGVIADPFACQQRGIVQVTAIEDNGLLEQSLELMAVRAADEIPFCADHERIGAFHGL